MEKPFTWLVRFDIAPEWVGDGFNLTDERALEMLGRDLDGACMSTELAARVISAPSALRIVREQGYAPKTSGAGEAVAAVIAGAPHAYAGSETIGGDVRVDSALIDAISLLEKVAFVQHENDNTGVVLSKLREALALVRGDQPISDIEWQTTPA